MDDGQLEQPDSVPREFGDGGIEKMIHGGDYFGIVLISVHVACNHRRHHMSQSRTNWPGRPVYKELHSPNPVRASDDSGFG